MHFRRSIVAAVAALAMGGISMLPDAGLAQDRVRRPLRPQQQSQVLPQPVRAVPMLAVVGLREQRVVVYDQHGAKMLESPVSSGSTGYETPPGIFSVVQKNVEHHSNLYDDASMPFMQRITWTGIALHAGALPGYPASHGCVRLPHDFAERLFEQTNVGLRVIVLRDAMAPAGIDAPSIFTAAAQGPGAGASDDGGTPHVVGQADDNAAQITRASAGGNRARGRASLEAIAYDKARAADISVERAKEARTAAARAATLAAPAVRLVKQAEANVARAEAEVKAADRILESNPKPQRMAQAETAKAKALERIEKTKTELAKVVQQSQARTDAASRAEAEAEAAAVAAAQATEDADQAKQNTSPVSVFVSRKTQRIYVRKAFQPIYEGPVSIKDAHKPIGSFVFTKLAPAEGTADRGWTVVSMYPDPLNIEPFKPAPKGKAAPKTEPVATNAAIAKAALDRIDVPRETAERISQVVLPGSSLIISDEAPSIETGKDTDFVVIMSGEPQGGIAIRAKPERTSRDDDDYGSRRRKGGGGGGFWFWD